MRILTRPHTILFWLRCLVIVVILPAWVATGWTIISSYKRERAVLQSGTTDTARALIAAVDRDLASMTAALQALATSPDLQSENLAAFHEQARKVVLSTEAGFGIALADATGQLIMSTLKPFGEPLSRSGAADLVQVVFESGKPAISDFFIGAASKRPQVATGVR